MIVNVITLVNPGAGVLAVNGETRLETFQVPAGKGILASKHKEVNYGRTT